MDLRKYIGIPFRDHGRGFDGCDCWGLCMLAYREELGLALPDLGDAYSEAYARGEVDATVRRTVAEPWNLDVTGGPYLPLDVLIFSRGGEDCHVGLWVATDEMLHVIEGIDACLERFDSARWKRKLSRVIRHRQRITNNAGLPSITGAKITEAEGSRVYVRLFNDRRVFHRPPPFALH